MKKILYGLTLSVLFFSEVGAESKPNIIYINIDDLGWADLGINGSTYYETPNIDQFAKEGMQFINGYAAASNCAPSRACAITGQYGPRHGVYTVNNSDRGKAKDRKLIPIENTIHIEESNLTFGHVLKQAGYKTINVGKWHVSEDPLNNGFDINIAGNQKGGPYTGGYHSPFKYPNLEVKEKGFYLTDKLTDEAIRLIRAHKGEPFFIYLPYYTVHKPLQAKEELVEKYKAKEPSRTQGNAVYAAMVQTMDENIGRLMQSLKVEGIDDNTMVVFTSDNGGINTISMQTPLRGGKGMYYEGGIREPFFIRWPDVIDKGSISETLVSNIDLFPTFCDIAGIVPPKEKVLDGVSLVPLFKNETIEPRSLYWHFPIYLQGYGKSDSAGMAEARDPKFRTRPGSVIRDGNWKLHQYFEDEGLELYNLKDDLSEKTNLAESNPEKTQELLAKLNNWRAQINAPIPTAPLITKHQSNQNKYSKRDY